MLLDQKAGQVLLDRQGLVGGSGASRIAGGSGALHTWVSRQVRCLTLAGGSGAPGQSWVSRQVRCLTLAGGSGASRIADGSGATRQS